MKHSILVVDDEKDIIDSIERQFRKQYRIFKATSGKEALAILKKETVQLILSDQRMPEMTGVQLFEKVKELQPDAVRILLTGYTDVESVIAAINTGQIYRYITKPWDPTDLDVNVRRALDAFDLKTELKEKNLKLEQALTELQTLDQAKNHFMILISHELKTPLTTSSSFLDLLKEENLSIEARKYVARISQGVERLREIVFDVLDVTSAETDQLLVKKEDQSVNELMAQVIAEFVDFISKKGLHLEVTEKKFKAHFDSKIITKVFRKIFHNAIKFSPENGEIKITVEEKNSEVRVSVTNVGPTISADRIQNIMKPFNLDEDIMHHSQGLGLGLSVAQSLLRRHGGNLQIQSASKVTTVTFTLQK